ncbi:DNA polymerase III, delta prime subunit [Thalassoporum mexicanum PCC 7367]|uniref:DNA polymerase III subunit delta' n=1 Tax=Thalassoporum mexicanum TaxID=3457544 RepID=UPI00029F8EEA|nr:DNA polymerase III subunit delta' [Pseudanabaena sp. PCC 7367]AFY70734.1 DNA polymerase III, delta prime subunit [Pseudanabaena sp. PCC 7367]
MAIENLDPFSQIIGQTSAVDLLKAAIKRDRIAPAYLFAGTPGIGRALTATAFATILIQDHKSTHRIHDRNHPDLLWVEPTYLDRGKLLTASQAAEQGLKRRAAPQIRLEQVRSIAEFLSKPPLESQRSIVVIEDAHTMAEAAANGLLKTLEEPGHGTIILIAPAAGNLLPTIVSRCQLIPFYRLSVAQVQLVLGKLGYSDLQLQILDLAQGSPGTALMAIDKLAEIPDEILEALEQIPAQPIAALTTAKQIAKDLDIETQLWLIEYLQNYFWRLYQGRSLHLPQIIQCLEQAHKLLNGYVQPRLVWEVTFLKMTDLRSGRLAIV